MLNFRTAEHVRSQSQAHGGVVLLDTAAGLWIALNPTAGDFWRSWESGAGFDEGIAAVAAHYPGIPAESIRADAERLIQDLFARGLLQAASPASAGSATVMAEPETPDTGPDPGWLRLLTAMVCVVAASVLLRCSFRMSLALVRATRRGWCRRAPTPRQATLTVAAVNRAARWYPSRTACLELSLAAVLMAAVSRGRLDWCLGSVPDPLRFHAWVEAAGQAVHAPGEFWSQFCYSPVLVA